MSTDVLAPGCWQVLDGATARRYCRNAKAAGFQARYFSRRRSWVGRNGFTFETLEYFVEVSQ